MRVSTIIFLCIFAGLYGNMRKRQHHASAGSEAQCQSDVCPQRQADDARLSHRCREIEGELRDTDRMLRDTDGSLKSLESTVRNLQDLVKKSERDLRNSRGRDGTRLRAQNLAQIQEQLDDVLAGHQKLGILRDDLTARREVLKARLQLARAGIDPDQDERGGSLEKPSPVDALTDAGRMIVVR